MIPKKRMTSNISPPPPSDGDELSLPPFFCSNPTLHTLSALAGVFVPNRISGSLVYVSRMIILQIRTPQWNILTMIKFVVTDIYGDDFFSKASKLSDINLVYVYLEENQLAYNICKIKMKTTYKKTRQDRKHHV